ncbi:MAG: sensor histidine kinase [Bacillus sp. (in: firmicutes)]
MADWSAKRRSVRIEIAERRDDVTISIIDDGVGMSEDTLTSLFVSDGRNRSGIGLSNTDKRLKQLYSRSLSIISAINQGISVTFYISKKAT